MVQTLWKLYGNPSKIKNSTVVLYDPTLLSGYLSKRNQDFEEISHSCVCCSFIHNSQDVETT